MKVYFDTKLGGVHDLISVSDTLVFVHEAFPDAIGYRPHARLPVDFHRLDDAEVGRHTATLDELSIDHELDFVAMFVCNLKSEVELDFTPFRSLSPVVELDPSIDDGDGPSITVDRESGMKLGLHLDTWDGLALSSRWKSRNRIVVNRGPRRQVFLCRTGPDREDGRVRRIRRTPPSLRSRRPLPPKPLPHPVSAPASAGQCRVCLLHGASCSRCLRESRRQSRGKPPLLGSLRRDLVPCRTDWRQLKSRARC